uniref:Uncharacterized protein n=1 Tax=Rhizophora mucronata TaxID=61149 RepID=A0A2P2PLU1_RHIMU
MAVLHIQYQLAQYLEQLEVSNKGYKHACTMIQIRSKYSGKSWVVFRQVL